MSRSREALTENRRGKAPELIRLVNSGPMTQALCVAAELQIPDLLTSGPMQAEELAKATSTHGPSMHRLMRALTSLDICVEREDGSFGLTATGSVLCVDASNSLRSWTILCGKYLWPTAGDLLHSIKTGETARQRIGQSSPFKFLESDKEAAAIFDHAMAEISRLVAGEVLSCCSFDGMQRVIDVGGGSGGLLAAVLKAHPELHGVLFDLPHVIQGAKADMTKAFPADRCEFVAGDFFESIPMGGDAYLLKAVLHDWDDEQCAAILRSCRRAIPSNGRLLLIERAVPERFEGNPIHHAIARMDLHMLVEFGGKERTEGEFRNLLEGAGFKLTSAVATSTEFSILEATPC
jgi:orsellinic acid C2-O-methyltransferase